MNNLNITPPEHLDFKNGSSLSQKWKSFKTQWKNYEIATGLNEKKAEVKLATFLCVIGPQGQEKYEHMKFE